MLRRRSVSALVLSLLTVLALPSSALADGSHRTVQMFDACDGPSFNAAIGPGTCDRNGGVTLDKFVGQLIDMGTAPSWRFSPAHLMLPAGGEIDAYNRGGEFHTFTEVANFGGGCVQPLNDLLGGLTPVPECADPSLFGTTGAAPGGKVETGAIGAGHHFFMCLIHPWMRTTVHAD